MNEENIKNDGNENNEDDFWEILGGAAVVGLAGYGVFKLGELIFGGNENTSNRSYNSRQISPQIQNFLHQAQIAMQESRFADAEYFALQSLKSSPNNPFGLNLLSASVLNQNKDDEKALEYALKAMQYIGNDQEGRLVILDNLTSVYFVKSDWANAIKYGVEYLDLFKKLYKNNYEPRSWCLDRVAKAYINNLQYEEAVGYLEACIKNSSNQRIFDSYGHLGFVRFKLNQFRLSIESYENAIKKLEISTNETEENKNKNLSIFYNWLGLLFGKVDEKNKEKICFNYFAHSIEKDQKNPFPFVNISELYAETKDYSNFEKSLEKGIALINKNLEWHKDLVSYILNKEELMNDERCKQFALNLLKSRNLINKDSFEFLANSLVATQEFLIDEKQKNNLKILIGQGELDKAFDELLPITKRKKKVHNEILVLLGDFSQTNRQLRLGIITSGDCKPVINRITQSLLIIIDKLANK